MTTVTLRFQGVGALLVASPNYTPEDWDLAVSELVARGFSPCHEDNEPMFISSTGTELYSWTKVHAPVPVFLDGAVR